MRIHLGKAAASAFRAIAVAFDRATSIVVLLAVNLVLIGYDLFKAGFALGKMSGHS